MVKVEELKITDLEQAEEAILDIECTKAGMDIMKYKALFKAIKIRNLDTRGANILKQTFLSKGGDVVVSHYAADFTKPTTDVLILATVHQYRLAIPVLMIQPWGLRDVGKALKSALSKENLI